MWKRCRRGALWDELGGLEADWTMSNFLMNLCHKNTAPLLSRGKSSQLIHEPLWLPACIWRNADPGCRVSEVQLVSQADSVKPNCAEVRRYQSALKLKAMFKTVVSLKRQQHNSIHAYILDNATLLWLECKGHGVIFRGTWMCSCVSHIVI